MRTRGETEGLRGESLRKVALAQTSRGKASGSLGAASGEERCSAEDVCIVYSGQADWDGFPDEQDSTESADRRRIVMLAS